MHGHRHPFVAALLSMMSYATFAQAESRRPANQRSDFNLGATVIPPLRSQGCHRPNHSRIGGSVKANARGAAKARNVRRNRRAHRG